MNIKDSPLLVHLLFCKRVKSFQNINEIYYTINGYQIAINSIPEYYEPWISSFLEFVDSYLMDMYYKGKFDKLPIHFGTIIETHIKNPIDGVNLFYELLNKYYNEKA